MVTSSRTSLVLCYDARTFNSDSLNYVGSSENIAKADLPAISAVFADEKISKQILSAAKRVSNPRKKSGTSSNGMSAAKRKRNIGEDGGRTEAERDVDLSLPVAEVEEEEMIKSTIQTNRAPLVLAFAVSLLKYTMPEQPLSSRLSLAQAVVSLNSQSKAKSIGIAVGRTAEEDGWAQGQPKVKVMGREIAAMRRGAYSTPQVVEEENSQATLQNEDAAPKQQPAFWGLDLEALRKSNGPLLPGKHASGQNDLPIHTPEAARGYLLRSFDLRQGDTELAEAKMKRESPAKKKQSTTEITARKDKACAVLLKALDMLYESWTSTLSSDELDRRAWSWYVKVRPDVAQGQAGWGQKGQVKLEDVLKLRRSG